MEYRYSKQNRIITDKRDIFVNRTARYIAPLLKLYSNELTIIFNSVKWIAFGINDLNYKEKLNNGDYIFCLAKITNNRIFENFAKYIREQKFYYDDYIFSLKNNLHMFVLENPRKDVVPKFMEGKYSEMLSKEEIDRIYLKKVYIKGVEHYTDVYSILTKYDAYKDKFLNYLESEFNYTNIEGDFEFDLPPLFNEEVFNYDETSPYSEEYFNQKKLIENAGIHS